MADSRKLLADLEEYKKRLDRHLTNLQHEFQTVSNRWQALNKVYEGDAADEFRAHWTRTSQSFQEYITQTQRISHVLEERIKWLRQANRQEGL